MAKFVQETNLKVLQVKQRVIIHISCTQSFKKQF